MRHPAVMVKPEQFRDLKRNCLVCDLVVALCREVQKLTRLRADCKNTAQRLNLLNYS